jgi:N-ethylmaleimide reductase
MGDLRLKNRMVMAPLTRSRADDEDAPHALHTEYYTQRATAGLIITEGSQISPQGKGYPSTPGIYSGRQIAGWRAVTHAVHDKGGLIFLQLWHVGRISLPSVQPDGALPVAPSAIRAEGKLFTYAGMKDLPVPRALSTDEMPGIVDQFRHAAMNALEAGFDGVEIHSANGYLLDQFLRDGSNQRTDSYGGAVPARARLLLEVTDAVVQVAGKARVGVRISPINQFNTMSDSAPKELFNYVASELGNRGIAYLHVIEQDGTGKVPGDSFDWVALRNAFGGTYIANGGYTQARAVAAIEAGRADLVAFGKLFIANPESPRRFAMEAGLNAPVPEKFYSGGPEGYTDYPFLPTIAGSEA